MYDAYSRAEPESRTAARAFVIPIRPNAETIERTVAVTRSSIAENPPRRLVCKFAFLICLSIVCGPTKIFQRSNTSDPERHRARAVPEELSFASWEIEVRVDRCT